MAACMADNSLEGGCLGLVWDGTGYGSDGAIWARSCSQGGYKGFRRAGSCGRYRSRAGGTRP